jgi:hypothetical protein
MRFVHLHWRRPRHPILQVFLGLAGLGLLLFFSVFALIAVAGVLAVMGLLRLWRGLTGRSPAPAAGSTDVIEGEFTVVRERDSANAQRIRYSP